MRICYSSWMVVSIACLGLSPALPSTCAAADKFPSTMPGASSTKAFDFGDIPLLGARSGDHARKEQSLSQTFSPPMGTVFRSNLPSGNGLTDSFHFGELPSTKSHFGTTNFGSGFFPQLHETSSEHLEPANLPPGTVRREFNGMIIYLVPL